MTKIINVLYLICISKTLFSKTTEFKFFSNLHGIIIKIDPFWNVKQPKSILKDLNQIVTSDHNGIEEKSNNKKIIKPYSCTLLDIMAIFKCIATENTNKIV